ncbi:MAG: glycosyltransferase, partial [Myxococcaceae bacterium]
MSETTVVLVFAGLFEPGFRGGGPVRSLVGMMDSIPSSAQVHLVTRDRDLGAGEPYAGVPSGRWLDRERARVFYLDIRSVRQWRELLQQLTPLRDAPIVYVNSVWDRPFSMVPVLLARARVLRPRLLLVAPRGEFSPGALALKQTRKSSLLAVWRRVLAGLPVVWHASAAPEARDIRTLFPDATIEIVPDQVSLPDTAEPVTHESGETLRLVFVSRISPKKNLAALLRGLRDVDRPVTLDLYGPREDARYWSRCEDLIDGLPAHIAVNHVGTLAPAAVRRTFGDYDAFVFPTLGENFGHVIAESLSASCPVVCPDTTPWTPVLESGGGVVLADVSAAAVTTAVCRLASASPRQRTEMRVRAGESYERWRRE